MYDKGTQVRFVRDQSADVPAGTIGTVRREGNGLLWIMLPDRSVITLEWDPDTIAKDIVPIDEELRLKVATKQAEDAFWSTLQELYPEMGSLPFNVGSSREEAFSEVAALVARNAVERRRKLLS